MDGSLSGLTMIISQHGTVGGMDLMSGAIVNVGSKRSTLNVERK